MGKGQPRKGAGIIERPAGSGNLYIRYYDEFGSDRKKRVTTNKMTDAKALLAKVKEEVRQRRLGLLPSRREADRVKLTVEKLIERYESEFAAKKSARDYKRYGEVWKDELGDFLASEVRPGDIEEWRQAAKLRGLKPNTINNHTSFLRRVFNLGIRDELVFHNPLGNGRVMPLKGVGRRERIISSDEELALLGVLAPRDRVAFIICLYTGLRRGEVMKMRREDVDLVNRIAYLPDTKAGRPQSIPLSGLVLDAITWLMDSHSAPYLFPSEKSRKSSTYGKYAAIRQEKAAGLSRKEISEKLGVSETTIHRALSQPADRESGGAELGHATGEQLLVRLKKAAASLGLRDILVHTLRHTFVTRVVGQGTDIGTARDLARHSTITMTQEYVHRQGQAKRDAVEQLALAANHQGADLFPPLPGRRGHLRALP
jgi:integrase